MTSGEVKIQDLEAAHKALSEVLPGEKNYATLSLLCTNVGETLKIEQKKNTWVPLKISKTGHYWNHAVVNDDDLMELAEFRINQLGEIKAIDTTSYSKDRVSFFYNGSDEMGPRYTLSTRYATFEIYVVVWPENAWPSVVVV